MSENGGIGRHARLRTLWPLGCGGSTPPSRTLFLFCFLQFSLLSGCSSSPEDVAVHSMESYSQGDINEFCRYLTPASSIWFKGLIEIGKGATFVPSESADIGIDVLRVHRIDDGVREKQDDGSIMVRDLAIVTLQVEGEEIPLPMIRLRQGWRIDLFSLADVWKGAAERALPPL